MTELLEQAIATLQALPGAEQDVIAAMIFAELEAEKQWDHLFSQSPNILAQLAASAMADYELGKTQALDPEGL